ncbi:regulator of microtubule dynamics protein 1 isoform X2 [Solenopsis invicta]|nr:regulator of microtubule dynamics protein 1 isoform X2 [Solenopsis invicta]XP_011155646.1 regulator of microtubule dynamics protein 1 isoform X2 [Solenopsis invicta]
MLQRLNRMTNCNRILQRAVLHKNVYPARKSENSVQIVRKVTIMSPFTVMGIWGVTKNNSQDEYKTQIATKELLTKADTLFDQGDYRGIYNLLSNYKDNKDVEILWRLSRAIYKMSEMASDVEGQKLIYEGYDLLCMALEIQEDHYAVHKWMSIFLNSKSILEGTKTLIKESYNIKKHMLRALELKPGDATLLYMIGCWCYEVASMPWYQRKIASIVFAEPPTSSLEESLSYLENAEKNDPNFYSRNLLMLGKTYLKLNRKEDAIKYLKKAAEFPAKDDEDQRTKQEAQKILNSI